MAATATTIRGEYASHFCWEVGSPKFCWEVRSPRSFSVEIGIETILPMLTFVATSEARNQRRHSGRLSCRERGGGCRRWRSIIFPDTDVGKICQLYRYFPS